MAISRPAYCTREDVKRAIDIKQTARANWQVDRAIQSSASNIEAHFHRIFYPHDATKYFDWPNFQSTYPWKIYLDQSELADVTVNVPVVTTGGRTNPTVIPAANLFWGPWNYAPPFTFVEIDRTTSSAFGLGGTPQRDVSIAGTYGWWIETDPAGTLAAGVPSTTATSVNVSDGSLVGVGNILIVDSERMIVSERSTLDSGQTNLTGLTTASTADVTGTVADGTQLHIDEVIQIDSERMLVADITGNSVTVKRAWDGTVLATHSTASTIYAFRTLTVLRGQLGTAAATHSNGAAAVVWRTPQLLRDLSLAESVNRALQETGGYSDPQGEGAGAIHGLGSALADLWDEAETAYARMARQRSV